MSQEFFSAKQVCASTGLDYETLKYYCKVGLIPNVARDAANRRRFSSANVAWINDLICLKKCDFSLKEIKRYLNLCLQGPKTLAERQELLATQRKLLSQKIADLQASVDYIDHKQALYRDFASGKAPYQSNLIDQNTL